MTDQAPPRRLHRSRTDRMIAGVAGGVAAHFEVDPVLIRLAFVALGFAGVGIAAYLIAWIVIPEEPLAAPTAHPAPGAPAVPAPADPFGPIPARRRLGGRLVIGVVLVGVGVILLVDRALPDLHNYLWPVVLIACGLGLFTYGARR